MQVYIATYRQIEIIGLALDRPFVVGEDTSLVSLLYSFQVVLAAELRMWWSFAQLILTSLWHSRYNAWSIT